MDKRPGLFIPVSESPGRSLVHTITNFQKPGFPGRRLGAFYSADHATEACSDVILVSQLQNVVNSARHSSCYRDSRQQAFSIANTRADGADAESPRRRAVLRESNDKPQSLSGRASIPSLPPERTGRGPRGWSKGCSHGTPAGNTMLAAKAMVDEMKEWLRSRRRSHRLSTPSSFAVVSTHERGAIAMPSSRSDSRDGR